MVLTDTFTRPSAGGFETLNVFMPGTPTSPAVCMLKFHADGGHTRIGWCMYDDLLGEMMDSIVSAVGDIKFPTYEALRAKYET